MTNAFIHQQQAGFYDGDSTNFTMLPPLQTFGEAIRRSGAQSMFDPVTMLEYITMNKFALTYVIIAAGVFVSSFIHTGYGLLEILQALDSVVITGSKRLEFGQTIIE
ncbi:hypothetical protein HPB49_013688 [Dermacentor silvarum]|uniref:Uncharacterized protein n=1 Tax=Dermacentor silvarum TaxID=543639 RepID=A0ACB8E0M9_DERSI|nr:hypothetical protein HPB49_013688 [Dermacentor silvarum]